MDTKEKLKNIISIILNGKDGGAKFIDGDDYYKLVKILGVTIHGNNMNSDKRKVYNALAKLVSNYPEAFSIYNITRPKYDNNVTYYNGKPILFRP